MILDFFESIYRKIQDVTFGSVLLLIGVLIILWVGVAEPIKHLAIYSTYDKSGNFQGLKNFVDYFSNPGLLSALYNSLYVSGIVTLVTVSLAFIISLGLIRCQVYGKAYIKLFTLIPLYVPSIFPCLGLIYILGSQGLLSDHLDGFELYGPSGVILGGIIFTLPHATILLTTTMRGIDHRLYLAANSLGASDFKQFTSITLASSQYGIISSCFVVFTLTMADFGIAKVLAGNYPMLATEIYKQVIGQQNFSMGATISLLLIVPSILAFLVNGWARKKLLRFSGNYSSIEPQKSWIKDTIFSIICWCVCLLLLSVIGVVVWGSFISYWPYDFSFTFRNYDFDLFGYGWEPYWNSLYLAVLVATFGTILTLLTSYLTERITLPPLVTPCIRLLSLLPLSIPGTVLGLAYIFCFNRPESILNGMMGTFLVLTLNCVVHLFSVSYLTFNSAFGKLDSNYERVASSLAVPNRVTFFRVILPNIKAPLFDVFFYLFVNTLTTVSAVVFLYGTDTILASIVILNMDDAGNLAAASSMGSALLLAAIVSKLIHFTLQKTFSVS